MMKRTLLVFTFAVLGLMLLAGSTLAGTGTGTTVSPAAAPAGGEFRQTFIPLMPKGFPPLPTVFGVELSSITPAGGLEPVTRAGTYWLRRNGVLWSEVEQTKGVRDWSVLAGLEAELINAAQRGTPVVLVVRGTPSWAQKYPGVQCGPIKETELNAFGDFMNALVRRYSSDPYYVKYWEIWNEPDVSRLSIPPDEKFGCWGEPGDPYYGGGYYAQALKTVYPRIKAADPHARVLLGGLLLNCDPALSCNGSGALPTKFLEGVLINGGVGAFDGISFHAYDFYFGHLGGYGNTNWNSNWMTTGPVVIGKARFIKSVLAAYGVSGKFLMNTEGALECGAADDPPGMGFCSDEPTSPFELTKAYYIPQLYAAAMAEGLEANFWFTALGWRNSGLLYDDLSPRPAYEAFKIARNTLLDSAFLGEINPLDVSSTGGIRGYKFDRGDQIVWVLWSIDGIPHPVSLIPGVPRKIFDALGNQETPRNPVIVDIIPRYYLWNPY